MTISRRVFLSGSAATMAAVAAPAVAAEGDARRREGGFANARYSLRAAMPEGADDLVVDVPVVKFDGDGWIVGQGFAGNGWTGTRSPVRDGPTAADDGVRVSGMSHSDAPGHGMHPIRGEVRITKL